MFNGIYKFNNLSIKNISIHFILLNIVILLINDYNLLLIIQLILKVIFNIHISNLEI